MQGRRVKAWRVPAASGILGGRIFDNLSSRCMTRPEIRNDAARPRASADQALSGDIRQRQLRII